MLDKITKKKNSFCASPLKIRELVPESQAYMDLLAFERKLDQTIMRKRVDIQEALKRPMKAVTPGQILVHICVCINVCFYRDAKAHCNAKNLTDQIPNLGALRSVKCNANGSQVSILITQVNA